MRAFFLLLLVYCGLGHVYAWNHNPQGAGFVSNPYALGAGNQGGLAYDPPPIQQTNLGESDEPSEFVPTSGFFGEGGGGFDIPAGQNDPNKNDGYDYGEQDQQPQPPRHPPRHAPQFDWSKFDNSSQQPAPQPAQESRPVHGGRSNPYDEAIPHQPVPLPQTPSNEDSSDPPRRRRGRRPRRHYPRPPCDDCDYGFMPPPPFFDGFMPPPPFIMPPPMPMMMPMQQTPQIIIISGGGMVMPGFPMMPPPPMPMFGPDPGPPIDMMGDAEDHRFHGFDDSYLVERGAQDCGCLSGDEHTRRGHGRRGRRDHGRSPGGPSELDSQSSESPDLWKKWWKTDRDSDSISEEGPKDPQISEVGQASVLLSAKPFAMPRNTKMTRRRKRAVYYY